MLYTRESLGAPYADYVDRAHAERAMAISASFVGAAAGLGDVAATVGRGMGRVGRSLVSSVVSARRRRVAMRQLQALDDRMLKDIGIPRGDIPYLVEQMLSEVRAVPSAAGTGCDIAAFPDRQATADGSRIPLRPAA